MTLFPRIHEARANILGYARAAKRHGAQGLLITDWGDGGHYNFTELSWHGLLFAAEAAWNARTQDSFDARFCTLLIGTKSKRFQSALVKLGDITHTQFGPHYQSIWKHLFFEPPTHPLFQAPKDAAWCSTGGDIALASLKLSPAFGQRTLKQLERIKSTLLDTQSTATDPYGWLPYWIYAVDTLIFSARKLMTFGGGRQPGRKEKHALAKELKNISSRFEELWMARNQRSEIRITLKRFKAQIRDLERG